MWTEALALANDMLRYWASKKTIKSSAEDLRTLSLHILSRAGFGKSFKFEGADERDMSTSPSSNYKESLQTILENCVLILAFGTKFLAIPWLPRKFQLVHEAWISFHAYMTNMYEEEKRAFAEGKTSDHNLLTLMVRASQDNTESQGLTEGEIYGNMFAFNFAGHDTTANTFTFALHFLVAYPDVQDWLSEEIQRVFGDRDPSQWDYRADFPHLKRCLSVMYETMRLYTPVPVLKWTGGREQPLTVGDKALILPPYTMVAPSYGSIQTDPKFWGSDSLSWQPSRWIKPADSSAVAAKSGGSVEELKLPVRGAFVGWSEGMRDCPGRKFSQVEFVATMAVLFREWRVDPVPLEGETIYAARKRVLNLIETDSYAVLLLQMLHPERATLRWRKV